MALVIWSVDWPARSLAISPTSFSSSTLCQCLRSSPSVLGAAMTRSLSNFPSSAFLFSSAATPPAKASSAWVSLSGLAPLE